MDQTAAAQAHQHNRRFLRLFALQKRRRCFHGVEPLDGDAQSDESQARARPGEEGPLVRQVVPRYAAGVGDGDCSEKFGPVWHGVVSVGVAQVLQV